MQIDTGYKARTQLLNGQYYFRQNRSTRPRKTLPRSTPVRSYQHRCASENLASPFGRRKKCSSVAMGFLLLMHSALTTNHYSHRECTALVCSQKSSFFTKHGQTAKKLSRQLLQNQYVGLGGCFFFPRNHPQDSMYVRHKTKRTQCSSPHMTEIQFLLVFTIPRAIFHIFLNTFSRRNRCE